jgi:hypothetical protein
MRTQHIYNVTVHLTAESAIFKQDFLFLPTPDELILVVQDRIGEIETAIDDGDQEYAEYLSRDLEHLTRVCEIVAAAKSLECHLAFGTTINKIVVGGTKVGEIHVPGHLALDRPKRRRK